MFQKNDFSEETKGEPFSSFDRFSSFFFSKKFVGFFGFVFGFGVGFGGAHFNGSFEEKFTGHNEAIVHPDIKVALSPTLDWASHGDWASHIDWASHGDWASHIDWASHGDWASHKISAGANRDDVVISGHDNWLDANHATDLHESTVRRHASIGRTLVWHWYAV